MKAWQWVVFGLVAAWALVVFGALGWGYVVMRRETGRGAKA